MGSATGSPSTRTSTGSPASRARSRQPVEAGEARQAVQRLALVAPHGAEEVAQLRHRLAAGARDHVRRPRSPDRDRRRPGGRAAEAWTTITLRSCASTSCSSRATRRRSAAMARRSSSSRSCSARSAFSASSRASRVWLRIIRPTSHGTTEKKTTGKKMSAGSSRMRDRDDRAGAEGEADQRAPEAQVGARRVGGGDQHEHDAEQVRRPGEHGLPEHRPTHDPADGDQRTRPPPQQAQAHRGEQREVERQRSLAGIRYRDLDPRHHEDDRDQAAVDHPPVALGQSLQPAPHPRPSCGSRASSLKPTPSAARRGAQHAP